MTTWQDEPPMSRRALRERERAQGQAAPDSSQSAQSFRVRDYTPEARGSQFSTVSSVSTDSAARLQSVGEAQSVQDARSVQDAHSAQPTPSGPVEERTMTRRELRALREAAEREAGRVPEPSGAGPVQTGEGFAALPELVEPQPHPPWQQPTDGSQQFSAPPPQPLMELEPEQFSAPAPPPQQFQDAAPAPEPAPPTWAQEPEPAPDVVVVPPEQFAPPVPEFDLPADAPIGSFARSDGHWSRQAELDAQTQRDDILPSRDLARIDAITTSALVLPSMPDYPIGPLSSTGEILVTGSIELPRMLGATGVHPARFDHSEVDSIIDAADREDSHPNSSPVRAIRAVSTHTSTQGIIASKRPRSKVPTFVLAGVATIMGAGVVVLFVGGMLLDVF